MTCNCPESGTSGSCPFHDASTRFTVEPQPGRWDTKLGRIVTALEDAAYERGRAEATAAAEQRLVALAGALRGVLAYHHRGPVLDTACAAALRALSAASGPPASPRQGEPVDVERLGFTDLLAVGRALLEHYPPDTIVCSHSVKADIGARTAAAITDLIDSCAAALSEPAEAGEPDPRVCPVCKRTIRKEASSTPRPSAGDHDPGSHVMAAYGSHQQDRGSSE